MRHVLALAEHGNFARAAVALRLSQPALSRSIQTLEQQIGTELFLRSAAGIVPTDIGRLVIQRARDVVRMVDDIDREILHSRRLSSGQVVVGGGPYPVETILSTALARFISTYPHVSARLEARSWDELLRRLRSREVDFFVAEISTLQQEYDLEIEPMTEHPLFFAARSGHPLAGRDDVAASDTFAYPFAALSRIPPRVLEHMLEAQSKTPDRAAARRAFPSVECYTLSAVKRIVQSSDALMAVTLPCIAAELEDGGIAVVGSEPWLSLRYGLVSLKGHPLSSAAAECRKLVIDAERAVTLEEKRLVARWTQGRYSGGTSPAPDQEQSPQAVMFEQQIDTSTCQP